LLYNDLFAESVCGKKGNAIVAAAIFCKKSRREFITVFFI